MTFFNCLRTLYPSIADELDDGRNMASLGIAYFLRITSIFGLYVPGGIVIQPDFQIEHIWARVPDMFQTAKDLFCRAGNLLLSEEV